MLRTPRNRSENLNRANPSNTKVSSQQQTVLWVLWLTYGSFYFCRTNISAALPGMEQELGYSKAELGTVLMSLKLAYGVGQFVNGQLAERLGPRKLLAIGLLGSAVLNVFFGWFTSLYFLTFVWACNGYVQALGWPSTMRVAANWFQASNRGRAIGIIGTGYQLCGVLSFFLSGWAADRFGWRGAFYVPAVLVGASAIHMLLFLKDTPKDPKPAPDQVVALGPAHSFRANILDTLSNPSLWLVALALYLLDACRYGFTDWGIAHLKEVQDIEVSTAAYKLAVLPLGGIAGSRKLVWARAASTALRRSSALAVLAT